MKNFYSLLYAIVLVTLCFSLTAQDISGTVFHDVNGNYINDDGAPLGGVDVFLHDEFDVATGIMTTTLGDGTYILTGGVAGTNYRVHIDVSTVLGGAGVATTRTGVITDLLNSDIDQVSYSTDPFTLNAGGNTDIEAGFFLTVDIGDVVFLDENGNGQNDDLNPILPAAVDVTLYQEDPLSIGTFNPATDYMGNPLPNPVNTTDFYNFTLVAPGNFYVEFGDGSGGGLFYTFPDIGGDASDSDANRATGQSPTFIMMSGDPAVTDVDGGYFAGATIEGLVWEDLDGDGLDNEGGAALPGGATVDVLLEVNDPIAGWIPVATLFDGTAIPANPINTNNLYSFMNLAPGEHRVTFSEPGAAVPADLHLTLEHVNDGGAPPPGDDTDDSDADRLTGVSPTFTILSAEVIQDIDAGYYLPLRIGNFVFEDRNGDGDQTGEPPLAAPPVTITLIDAVTGLTANDVDGNPIPTQNQDGAGMYLFFPTPPGDYIVQFDWTEPDIFATEGNATTDDLDSDILDCFGGGTPNTGQTAPTGPLISNASFLDMDAGFVRPAEVSDFVWEDLNGNGLQDGGEPGLDGVTVELIDDATGVVADLLDCTPATTVTAGGGMYMFDRVKPGDYRVRFTLLAGPDPYYFTTANVNGENTSANPGMQDSDADEITGETFVFSVIAGQIQDNIDCGMYRAADLGNYTWHDENGDGLDDGTEPALGGVTVSIINVVTGLVPNDLTTGAPVVNPVVSDGAGLYMFENIPPGMYQLTFGPPAADWYITRVNQAGGATDATDVANDSDPDPINANTTHVIELESNEDELDVDAGLFRATEIGDKVWHDANADGIFDAGEGAPIPAGFVITVIDVTTGAPAIDINGNPAVQAIPPSGMYMFTIANGNALFPGEYQVVLTVPAPWIISEPDQTGDANDSDFDPGSGATVMNVILMSDEMTMDIDAGVYQNVTLGGFMWGETNGNCSYDVGTETVYMGVSIQLIDVNSGTGDGPTVQTDAMGAYCFENVKPGDYELLIPADMFIQDAPLNNLIPCGPGNDPNDDVTLDNNGDGAAGGPVMTAVIELRCGEEPGGPDMTINKTVDFGFEFDCDTENNPFAELECMDAEPICDLTLLEQGCGTMPFNGNGLGPNPLCDGGGVPHNMSWFAFIAGMNPGGYQIEVALDGCVPGNQGGNSTGVQSGIYTDCTWSESVVCNNGCSANPVDIIIPSDDLIPGNPYWFWVDGCNGSVCGYNINILGNFIPFSLPDPFELLCDGEAGDCEKICPGTTITWEVLDDPNDPINQNGVPIFPDLELELPDFGFFWTITDPNGVEVYNEQLEVNNITYQFDEVGIYEICMENIEYRCKNLPVTGICKEIEVIIIEDEDFGLIEICEDELISYTGPTSVNDEGGVTDPNGDETDGWQVPGTQFFDGPNIVDVTTSKGCMYQQEVEILQLFDSDIGIVDTAVCGIPLGGVTILGDFYNNEIEGFFKEFDGFASNGCDSLATITLLDLRIDGEVQDLGCVPGGFGLQFVQSDYNNSRDYPVSYEWQDANGMPIPDDGDGDPFTTIVPSAGIYKLVVVMETDFDPPAFQVMCPFEFTIDLDTDGILPAPPEADNWINQFCEYDATGLYVAEITEDPSTILSIDWTFPAGASVVSGLGTDSLTLDWTGTTGGEVCVTITNECGTSLPVCDTVMITPTPLALIDPLDTICVDSMTTVLFPGTQDPNFTYAWNFGGGTPAGNTNVAGPIDVVWNVPGEKTITLRLTKDGCISDEATALIEVVEPVAPPVITCTSTIDEVVFTWNDPGGQTGYIPSSVTPGGVLNGNTFTIGNLMVGDDVEMTLITTTNSPCGDLISTGTCKAQDCPANAVMPDPVTDICVDASTAEINLSATLTTQINGNYVWDGPGVTDMAAGTFDPKVADEGANNITVLFVDENLCEYNNTLLINVNSIPESPFTTDMVVCQDSTVSVEYTGVTTGAQFDWTFGDVVAPGNGAGPFDLQWMTPGNKQIALTLTKAGCTSPESMLNVLVEPRIEPLDIDCDEDATSIGITWNDLLNVNGYDLYIDNVLILDDTQLTNFDLTGLPTETIVEIRLVANSDNSCPGVELIQMCQALDCPSGDVIFNVQDTTLCLNASALPFNLEATVMGGLNSGNGTGMWSGLGVDPMTGVFTPADAGVSSSAGHIITYTFTDGSCVYEDAIRITIIDQPTSDFNGDPVICVADQLLVTYTGTAPNLPFDWNIEGGGTVTPGTGNEYGISWTQPGNYNISLQVGQGSCLSDISDIQVQVDPEMVPVDISCTSTLNSVTFNWGDIDCADDYQVSINNVVIGTQNTLEYLEDNLNEGDIVTIEILPIEDCACPAVPATLECEAKACPPVNLVLSSSETKFCEGTITSIINLQVDVQGSVEQGTGIWVGDGGVTEAGAFDPNGKDPGLYTFTYQYLESNCDFDNSITIEILPNPEVTASPTDPICYQDNFGSVIVDPTGGTGTNFDIQLTGNPGDLTMLDPGTYNVIATDEENCSAETSFTIMDAIAAQLEINGNTIIKAGEDGELMADVTSIDGMVDSIVWISDGEILCSGPDCETLTISPDRDADEIEYCAVLYYNDGCTVQECITIRVRRTDIIILPNIILIGSEASNEQFFIPEYETIMQVRSLYIYDRWGNKMFSAQNVPKGPGNGWNGKMDGKDVEQGVYVYTVELDMENGEILKLSGDLTVISNAR